jgi:hypothetical protein
MQTNNGTEEISEEKTRRNKRWEVNNRKKQENVNKY